MIETLGAQLTYIPLSDIHRGGTYQIRRPSSEKDAALLQSLLKSGQTHPILLERTESNQLQILDGHRRFDSILKIQSGGGTWEKILARIVSSESLTPLERFRLIKERNFSSENAYGLYERAVFFKKFIEDGLTIAILSEETGLAHHAVEDTIELSAAQPPLAALINQAALEPMFALMLHQRFVGWQAAFPAQAETIARQLVRHAQHEKPNVKTWRFLLDFYWSNNRPFLNGRLKPH